MVVNDTEGSQPIRVIVPVRYIRIGEAVMAVELNPFSVGYLGWMDEEIGLIR